ncbi:MAG TPA: hypothetical protein PKW33_20310 [Anaerolineaceae bacterium]|nr:hypothetical protein [Anaerolineaceae bacterium]HPN53950.1 hypothetical protein [Anaerolineaceae bacterium]
MEDITPALERKESIGEKNYLFANLLKLAEVRNFYDSNSARLTEFSPAVQKKYTGSMEEGTLDYFCFREILKGNLSGGKHPLSASRLKAFLLTYIGQKGFDTYTKIFNLLSAGTPELKSLLMDREIISKMKEMGIVPHPLRDSLTPGIDGHIIGREKLAFWIGTVQERKWNFLIGAPGVGKSTVMRLIAHDHRLCEFDHVFWISGETEESVVASLVRIVNIYQTEKIIYDENIPNLFSRLESFSIHDRAIVLVENCRSKRIFHSIRNCFPPSWHLLLEVGDQEMLTGGEMSLENVIEVENFNRAELESFWTYWVKKMDFQREIFDQLSQMTRNNPFTLFVSLCYATTFGTDLALQEFKEFPHKSVIEIILERLDERTRECLLKLGVLPHLWSHRLPVFLALWDMDEHKTREILAIFTQLGLVTKTEGVDEWKISPSVINHSFLEMTEKMRSTARNWISRCDIKSINVRLINEYRKNHPKEKEKRPDLRPNALVRVIRQIIDPQRWNTANKLFEGSTRFLTSDEYLAQQFELRMDIRFFQLARVLVSLIFLITILSFFNGWGGINFEELLARIVAFLILWGLIVGALYTFPFFRERDYIIFAIWREAQKRKEKPNS